LELLIFLPEELLVVALELELASETWAMGAKMLDE
jgi:hypothetical protein